MTPRVLIVYGTSYGQTERIARRIDDLLTQREFAVTTTRGDAIPPGLELDAFDGVLVGASMIIGGYQKCIRKFVRHRAGALNAIPSGFFAVSGSAGSSSFAERAEAARISATFCREAGWRPSLSASIAGAIRYTKYNFVLRWVMKRISRKEGVSTDTSRDHEYTDWVQVELFATTFADLVSASIEHPAPVGVGP